MKIRFGLKFKNAVFLLSLFAITLGLLFFTVSETSKNSHYLYHFKYLNIIREIFKQDLQKSVVEGKNIKVSCKELLEMYIKIVPGFKGIILSDSDGIIFDSTNKKEYKTFFLKSGMKPVISSYGGRLYLIEVFSGYKIMWIFNISNIENWNFFQQNPEFYFIGALLLFFALFISLFISEMLIKPIDKIVEFAKAVASGDYFRDIEIDSADEIEELAVNINFMKDSLKEKITGLESINSFIEGIFALSMSGIAVTDPRYMIIKYNRKIEDILEMKIINSFDMRQYLHNNFFIKSLNKKILFDFENFRTGESFEIIRKDNSRKEKVLLISASELRATNNDLTGYIFNFEDVTRIKLYQTTLQETEKMAVLGRLSAKLTHEIKNPLATINSLSQHLVEENEVLNSSERKELLDTVYSEVQRLGVILGDVSKWSRHSCDSETDCFNLREVLDSIIALTSFDFRKRKIHFTFDMDQNDEPLYICGSADRFKQIIFNLLWNAMDVLNESVAEVHKISLNYYNKDEYIYITIKDNGDGMTENELSRIFEPFYTTKREGMGLGLAIVSDIVRSMEGKMTVCSVPSEGTEFGLVFKLFCPEAEING